MKRVMALAILSMLISAAARGQQRTSGIDASAFDRRTRIQDDLFQHVNGTWLERTEIPSDKSSYGSFAILDDRSQERIRDLIEELARTEHPVGSLEQKIADFYRSFRDEERAEQLGLKPLAEQLEAIERIGDAAELAHAFGALRPVGVSTPIAFYIDQDDRQATQYIAHLTQSGTTLPDRDYYLLDDEKYAAARTALQQYIAKLAEASGADDPAGVAADLLALETRLADKQWPRTELRDAEKRYNKYAAADLSRLGSRFDWPQFFRGVGGESIDELIVTTPSYFEGLDAIFAETPLETWKQYLKFKLIDDYAPLLSRALADAHFDLHQRTLGGVAEQKPRWRRGVELIAGSGGFGALGDAVGKMYVDRHFPPEHKQRMEELVANLLKAFEGSVDELTWMTDETKQRAREKLAKITTKIGYTRKWRDYTALEVRADDLVGNAIRSAQVEHHRNLDKLGQPIDREEWGLTPQTVNAYYNPSLNEIVFPAAILQPPFFNPAADDAVNYGGIGAVIGHEISHAFDDQGSRYDGDGNLKNWWTEEDARRFKELTQRLVDQYDAYQPLPGRNVNGQFTLGENIADLSGLSIAYKAYRLSLAGQEPSEIDGWTAEQRFFIGWSQVWRRKYRDDDMIRRLAVDPHSPSYFRANGPVANIDAFYEAFGLGPQDALFKAPEQRIRIW